MNSKRITISIISLQLLDRIDQQAIDKDISRARVIEGILIDHFNLKTVKYVPYFAKLSSEECQLAQVKATESRMSKKEKVKM